MLISTKDGVSHFMAWLPLRWRLSFWLRGPARSRLQSSLQSSQENLSPAAPLLGYPCAMPSRTRPFWLAPPPVLACESLVAAAPAAATVVYVSAEDAGEVVAVDIDKGEVVARI